MEKQVEYQGIGYAPLQLINEDVYNVIARQESTIDVGGNMFASFTVNTIEGLVDLFYKNSDELSYKDFVKVLSNSMMEALHDGTKTGISSVLKEALGLETLGEVAIDFTSGFLYDFSRSAYKHYTGEIDADQLLEKTSKSALDSILGGLTGTVWGYGRRICSDIVGLGATIGSMLATPAGVIMGSVFCTGVTACIRTTIINNAQKDAYARIEDSLGTYYHQLELQDGVSVVPLQIIDDISDFQGTSGFSLKGLVPMYNIISDFEEYNYRKNVLINMEKEFVERRKEWDFRAYQLKQAMIDMQRQRVAQLEVKYNVAMQELKSDFVLRIRYGVEEQYQQYLSVAQYINGEIETKRTELQKIEREQKASVEKQRQKREVNEKFIHILETMDLSDGNETDTVKEMVGIIIDQLNEDSFIATVNAEDIIPLLR
jgi:hypothetical protein